MVYFNATDYIRRKGEVSPRVMSDFQSGFAFWIKALGSAYSLSPEDREIYLYRRILFPPPSRGYRD
jgi:hypothetical protein